MEDEDDVCAVVGGAEDEEVPVAPVGEDEDEDEDEDEEEEDEDEDGGADVPVVSVVKNT